MEELDVAVEVIEEPEEVWVVPNGLSQWADGFTRVVPADALSGRGRI